ncbi:MAG TPA: hypothetical protein VF342_05250 [Alphaproteobacteria bacterium]
MKHGMRHVPLDERRDLVIDNLRAMVTAQSALIFGLLTVLGDSRVVSQCDLRNVFRTALEMVDEVGVSMAGRMPGGLESARLWLQQLLDDMPQTWSA